MADVTRKWAWWWAAAPATEADLNNRRDPGLDLFRGLAVIAMVAVHCEHITPVMGQGWSAALLRCLVFGEPVISAAFAFAAGWAVMAKLSKRLPNDAVSKRAKRRLPRLTMLYLLGVALFIPQHGFSLPDVLLSPDVLWPIGLGSWLVERCWRTRHRAALSVMLGSILGAAALLDMSRLTVVGLNGGPGALLPLVGFSAFGGLTGMCWSQPRALRWLVALSGLAIVLVLASGAPWTMRHPSHFAGTGLPLAASLATADTTRIVWFWNHTAAGAAGLMGVLLAGSLACRGVATAVPKLLRPVVVLGRLSLATYVVHFVILGIIVLLGVIPRNATQACVLALGLVSAAAMAGHVREWLHRRSALVALAAPRGSAP